MVQHVVNARIKIMDM